MKKIPSKEKLIESLLSERVIDELRISPSNYDHFGFILNEYFQPYFNVDVEVFLTYSNFRNCEICPIGDKYIIIYDQYLGQTFNRLNHCVEVLKRYPNADQRLIPLQNYSYKFLAEFFRIQCEQSVSIFFADMYEKELPIANAILNKAEQEMEDSFFCNRHIRTYVQEIFAFTHELSHILIEKDTKLQEKILFNKDYLNPLNRAKIRTYLKIIDNKNELFEKPNDSNMHFLKEIENLKNEIDLIKSDEEKCIHWSKEITCDELAAEYVFSFGKTIGLSQIDLIESIWIGAVFVWWQSALKEIGSNYILQNGIKIFSGNFPMFYYADTRRKRIESILFANIRDLGDGITEKAYEHFNLLTDKVFLPIYSILRSIENGLISIDSKVDIYKEITSNWQDLVDSVTGWKLDHKFFANPIMPITAFDPQKTNYDNELRMGTAIFAGGSSMDIYFSEDRIFIIEDAEMSSEIIKSKQEKGKLYNSKGLIYHQVGDSAKAKYLYTKAYNNELFDDPIVLKNLGLVMMQVGDIEKAKDYFQAALNISENDAEIYNSLANLYSWEREDIAEKYFQKAYSISPTDPIILQNISFFYYHKNDFSQAFRFFNELKETDINQPKHHFYLGDVSEKIGDNNSAKINYSQAILKDPNYFEAHKNLGTVLNRLGEVENAETHFLKAIAIKPDYKEAELQLAAMLKNNFRVEEAINHYKRALEIDPNYTDASYNLGLLYEEIHEYPLAISNFINVICINEYDIETMEHLAFLFLIEKQFQLSFAMCTNILTLDPTNLLAFNTLHELNNIKS